MDRLKTLAPFIIALASFVVSAYANYNNNDKAITGRIIVIETKQEGDKEWRADVKAQLNRMDTKLDEIRKEVK